MTINKESKFFITHLVHRSIWGGLAVGKLTLFAIVINLFLLAHNGYASSILARGELLSPAPSYPTVLNHWSLGIQNSLATYQDKKTGQDEKKQRIHAIPTVYVTGQLPLRLSLKSYVGYIKLNDEREQIKVQQRLLGLGLGKVIGSNSYVSTSIYGVSQWTDTQASGALVVEEYESSYDSRSSLFGVMLQVADSRDAFFANLGAAQSNQNAEFQLVKSLPAIKNQSPASLADSVPLVWLELGYRFSKNVSLSLTEQKTPNNIILPRVNLSCEMVLH